MKFIDFNPPSPPIGGYGGRVIGLIPRSFSQRLICLWHDAAEKRVQSLLWGSYHLIKIPIAKTLIIVAVIFIF